MRIKLLYVLEDDLKSVEANGGLRLAVFVMDTRGEWCLLDQHVSDSIDELYAWADDQTFEVIELSTSEDHYLPNSRKEQLQ